MKFIDLECNWDEKLFTLDERFITTVNHIFKKLIEDSMLIFSE